MTNNSIILSTDHSLGRAQGYKIPGILGDRRARTVTLTHLHKEQSPQERATSFCPRHTPHTDPHIAEDLGSNPVFSVTYSGPQPSRWHMEMGEEDDSDYPVTCECYRARRESSGQARPDGPSRPRLKTSEEKHEHWEHEAGIPYASDGPPHAAVTAVTRHRHTHAAAQKTRPAAQTCGDQCKLKGRSYVMYMNYRNLGTVTQPNVRISLEQRFSVFRVPGDRLGVRVQTLRPGSAWGSGALLPPALGTKDAAGPRGPNRSSQTFQHLEITRGLKHADAGVPPPENNIGLSVGGGPTVRPLQVELHLYLHTEASRGSPGNATMQ